MVKTKVSMLSVPRGFPSGAFSGFRAAMRGFSFVAAREFRIPLIVYFGQLSKVSHTNGHQTKRHNPALKRTCANSRAGPLSSALGPSISCLSGRPFSFRSQPSRSPGVWSPARYSRAFSSAAQSGLRLLHQKQSCRRLLLHAPRMERLRVQCNVQRPLTAQSPMSSPLIASPTRTSEKIKRLRPHHRRLLVRVSKATRGPTLHSSGPARRAAQVAQFQR